MSILFDYDPVTGLKETFDYDPINDAVTITTEQDITGFLDQMKALRNNPELSAKGIKEDWWLVAKVPQVVELELMKQGLFLSNPDNLKQIHKIIQRDYPYLKATDKKHA